MHISKGNMMGVTPTILSIDITKYKNKILEFLNGLKTRVLNKKSNNVGHVSTINTQRLNEEYMEYKNIIWIHSILESVDELALMLKETTLIDEELFDFLEIQQITEYILKNQNYVKINNDEITFIANLFKKFTNLLSIKFDLFKDKTSKNQVENEILLRYKQEYASFEEMFSKDKERFYSEMYTPSGNHKKTINNLYAIMKE